MTVCACSKYLQKKPQDVGYTCYGGRPKAGACEFFVLLWKTHKHGSVTINHKIAERQKKVKKKSQKFWEGSEAIYETLRA